MWINRIHCCLLAVAHLYILNHLVYSQESDSSYKAQNLTCITHKLVEVICTWTTEYESTNNLGFSYEFCYTIGWQKNCSITEERSQEFPLILFGSFNIDITTLNSSEEVKPPIATNTFLLTEKDIKFVPPTPRIHRLTPDFISDTLELEWYDGGSNFLYQMDADWEIQILYKDPMEEVTLITYSSKLTGNDTLLYWKWTSNLPFNCTTHYVRIRCLLHENTFAGVNVWSEWSQPEHIPGKDTGSFGAVYPIEKIVPVGSNMTFCCVWKKGENKFLLKYQSCPPQQCPVASLSNYSKLIHVQNVSASSSSGTNIWCQGKVPPSPDTPLYGTVLFAGYPPDVPQNVSCETQDLKEIICKWEQGRPTQLYGRRKTSYTLIEQISRRYVKYTGDNQHYKCNLLVLNNQTMYNITIHATNHLGHSEASLSINVKYRIHPQPPTDLTVTDNSPTNVSLSWYLPGSFMKTKLQFQVKVSNGTSTEERKMHLDGAENSRYTILVDNLHPYTSYTFQVRCSAAEPFFWKWSNWSKGIPHRTQEAPPAGKLDVWREKSADEGTVIIFWKPLPVPDRNGVIEGYEVSWIVPEAAMKKQSVSEVSNSIKIKLGRNDYIFTVVAKNKAGLSSPSLINSAEIPVGPVPTETGVAKEDGIQVAWLSDPSVTCGYTVRWCYGPEPCTAVSWETFPSNVTNPVIRSALFQPGVRYHFSLYGCKDNGYQLLKHIDGYTKELEPAVAPVFNVELTTSDSILIKWEDIPNEKSRGFLKGYLLHFGKGEEGTTKPKSFESGHRAINITNPEQKTLKIASLQGKTGYHLNLSGYTAGGIGPARSLYVVTKENAVGLIIAILIPVAIVVVLAVVASIFCYRKREWIKETFYPDIPNPENCKALEFPKDPEGNPNSKTLEMNPCTPNNIEVVETQTSCLKIEDAAIKLPVTEELPEDGLDSESESHIVVSYCPSIIEEEISNPPIDGSMGSSQVVYIDIQTMYPAPDKMKEDLEVDCVVAAGYKPQMQPPRNTEETTSVDEDLDKAAGYRPQVNAPSWNTNCPDSPVSMESNNENASFGSPCSINSRQFLIPPKEDEDSPEVINTGWSFSNFFHNKPND